MSSTRLFQWLSLVSPSCISLLHYSLDPSPLFTDKIPPGTTSSVALSYFALQISFTTIASSNTFEMCESNFALFSMWIFLWLTSASPFTAHIHIVSQMEKNTRKVSNVFYRFNKQIFMTYKVFTEIPKRLLSVLYNSSLALLPYFFRLTCLVKRDFNHFGLSDSINLPGILHHVFLLKCLLHMW